MPVAFHLPFVHQHKRSRDQGSALQDGLLQISNQAWQILVNSGPSSHSEDPLLGDSSSKSKEVYMICNLPSTSGASVHPADRPVGTETGARPKTTLLRRDDNNSSIKRKRKAVVDGRDSSAGIEIDWELWDSRFMLKDEENDDKWRGWCRPSCVPITIILILIVLVVLLPLLDQKWDNNDSTNSAQWDECRQTCSMSIVESIPQGLTYNTTVKHPSTYDSWMNLLDIATEKIELGSYYWTLRTSDVQPTNPTSIEGEKIWLGLLHAGLNRSIQVKIAQNEPSSTSDNRDTAILQNRGAAEVRTLDFDRLIGAGILHTKFWVVDRKHVYIGSANFDWRSLTQVKELGIMVYNCSCFAEDLGKVFDVYWALGLPEATVPSQWPSSYSTKYNADNPMQLAFDGVKTRTYISSSPPPFSPSGREQDVDAITTVIDAAQKFVYVSVMDYDPLMIYTTPKTFWPVIDDHLRAAAINRAVTVRLLISKWQHSSQSMFYFLNSLQAINQAYWAVNVEVRIFVVPAFTPSQTAIPYARVNHNKYMVTDNAAYIGTSNWSGDYFVNTAGVGVVINQTASSQSAWNYGSSTTAADLRQQVQDIFERDWYSDYSHPLSDYIPAMNGSNT